MSREFHGATDEFVTVSPGALSNCDGGPISFFSIHRPASVAAMGLIAAREDGFRIWGVNPFSDGEIYFGTSAGSTSSDPTTYAGSDEWRCDGFTKAGGSSTARFHSSKQTSGAWESWTHADKDAVADGVFTTEIDEVWLAALTNSQTYVGRKCVTAVWKSVLSDAQVETLTRTLASWMQLLPDTCWPFNQASTSDPVLDITGGGANQTALGAGTTVSTDEPGGWSYHLPRTSGMLAFP